MKKDETVVDLPAPNNKPVCGIVMPISSIDGCNEEHWIDVRSILYESIESAGFDPKIVSHADDVGVIQKRIVQNLYDNPIVVCDVSCKNPNVMFELGMRLAFDKAVVIVKDDKTNYSFDTSQIEHITYPRDLRFSRIVDFKEELARKIISTVEASKKSDFTSFLAHFGEFKVAKIDSKEISSEQYILEELQLVRRELREVARRTKMFNVEGLKMRKIGFEITEPSERSIEDILSHIPLMYRERGTTTMRSPNGVVTLWFEVGGVEEIAIMVSRLSEITGSKVKVISD